MILRKQVAEADATFDYVTKMFLRIKKKDK